MVMRRPTETWSLLPPASQLLWLFIVYWEILTGNREHLATQTRNRNYSSLHKVKNSNFRWDQPQNGISVLSLIVGRRWRQIKGTHGSSWELDHNTVHMHSHPQLWQDDGMVAPVCPKPEAFCSPHISRSTFSLHSQLRHIIVRQLRSISYNPVVFLRWDSDTGTCILGHSVRSGSWMALAPSVKEIETGLRYRILV
jgi:hypothetical protein